MRTIANAKHRAELRELLRAAEDLRGQRDSNAERLNVVDERLVALRDRRQELERSRVRAYDEASEAERTEHLLAGGDPEDRPLVTSTERAEHNSKLDAAVRQSKEDEKLLLDARHGAQQREEHLARDVSAAESQYLMRLGEVLADEFRTEVKRIAERLYPAVRAVRAHAGSEGNPASHVFGWVRIGWKNPDGAQEQVWPPEGAGEHGDPFDAAHVFEGIAAELLADGKSG